MADEIELLRLFREEMPGPSTGAWARARAAIAAARAQEEPAGRWRRRWPGRRRRQAAGVAAVAAAVGVLLAIVVTSSPPARSPGAAGAQRDRDTAYVISRVQHALASPANGSRAGYSRTVFRHGATVTVGPGGSLTIQAGTSAGTAGGVGSVTARWYRGTYKVSAFTAAGQRVLAVRTTTTAQGRAAETLIVDYRDATWWRAASQVPPAASTPAPSVCGGSGVDLGPGGWPAFIGYQLACGGYTAVGRQRVDGVSAIKLTQPSGPSTLWVNPATYLPVHAVSGGPQPIQTGFRWLPPAAAHLAALSLPVPAGFRQVPPP